MTHQISELSNSSLVRTAQIHQSRLAALDEVRVYLQLHLPSFPSLAELELGPWFATVGDPKLRLRPRDVRMFNPNTVLRRWRSGLEHLRRMKPNVVGFCVVELQLCRALQRTGHHQSRYFYEPHFHAVIWGATEQEVKDAFRVRKSSIVTVRKRSAKVQAVYDLDGLIGYFTKFRPDFRRQLQDPATGQTGWARSRYPADRKSDWYAAMSNYRVSDLLSGTGKLLRKLPDFTMAELAAGDGDEL